MNDKIINAVDNVLDKNREYKHKVDKQLETKNRKKTIKKMTTYNSSNPENNTPPEKYENMNQIISDIYDISRFIDCYQYNGIKADRENYVNLRDDVLQALSDSIHLIREMNDMLSTDKD